MYFTASTSAKSTSLREKLSMLSGERQSILEVCIVSLYSRVFFYSSAFLPSANVVCEGYVFTPVCQSFCSQGGSASVHAGSRHPPGPDPPGTDTPPGSRHLPGTRPSLGAGTLPGRRLLLRTVHILLECILLNKNAFQLDAY